MRPEGLYTALVTPFDGNGAIDTEALTRHVSQLGDKGVRGFFACGTTGDGAFLTSDEKERVFAAVLEEVPQDAEVVGAVIAPDTRSAVRDVHRLAEHGLAYVAVVSPYYGAVGEQELIDHYLSVADAATCPVLAYDIPGCTHNPLMDAVYDAVLKHPNIVGVKDSSGDFSAFSRRLLQESGTRTTSWIQGDDSLDASALLVGASGIVSGLSNILPEPFVEMLRAHRANDSHTMLAMQRVINTLHGIVRITGRATDAVRLALSLQGLGSRHGTSVHRGLGSEWDKPVSAAVTAATEQMHAFRTQ